MYLPVWHLSPVYPEMQMHVKFCVIPRRIHVPLFAQGSSTQGLISMSNIAKFWNWSNDIYITFKQAVHAEISILHLSFRENSIWIICCWKTYFNSHLSIWKNNVIRYKWITFIFIFFHKHPLLYLKNTHEIIFKIDLFNEKKKSFNWGLYKKGNIQIVFHSFTNL